MLLARVPIYGHVSLFVTTVANCKEKGVNMGDEDKYRSYIAGGTLAAAVWTFVQLPKTHSPAIRNWHPERCRK